MKKIINNALEELSKNSTLDEIKKVLIEKCKEVDFSIDIEDWNYMFNEIVYRLSQ